MAVLALQLTSAGAQATTTFNAGKAEGATCSRASGPRGITPALWADRAKAHAVLARPGFSTIETTALDGKHLLVHVYRPSRFDAAHGRLWFVMHGATRDADRYAQLAAPVAERHQVMAIAVEFSRQAYPSGDEYTMGVLTQGRIGASALREGRWRQPQEFAYNELERIFDSVRQAIGGRQEGYYLFGHSAGAQFTHRLLTFVPCARVLGAVAANAGWYTLPGMDSRQPFAVPYSLRATPPDASDTRALLMAPLTLLLGTQDVQNPEEDNRVRGTRAAMAQGANRLARGHHYYEVGRTLAQNRGVPFGWRLQLAPGAGHDAAEVIASAGYLLFAPPTAPACRASMASEARSLVLNEVLADPPAGPAGDLNADGTRSGREEQFIEIVNTGNQPLCLTGWRLSSSSAGGGHLFPIGSALAPGKALLLFGGGVPTGPFGAATVQRATSAPGLDLDPTGGELLLRDGVGALATRFTWGHCAGAACATDHWQGSLPAGSSLVRWPGPDSGWRMHREVANAPASPGLRNDGKPW